MFVADDEPRDRVPRSRLIGSKLHRERVAFQRSQVGVEEIVGGHLGTGLEWLSEPKILVGHVK